ncbi:MAG: response regulator transcription factor [Oscillospiraceae bacterium]|nr:response regulator transcription factor [Oscillospiraceae bacterium]MBR2080944.1 response regulator transcription factor [Oscillospiraceae bacterium]MBR2366791.1 response regulator transcription factor [Oscillospiraceae bacterium]MBR2897853.1 response regulator transcription factor [Oscillospiraceae bacterium]MBR2976962.1 response regulator transcription factor [Oscillospiraceae bacterium]
MGKKVLIVEDEQAIVDILKFNLQNEGYETLEALDGEEGLRLAREADPDLILLDVMLPKMNGFEVCGAIRADGRAVPILMLTAREEESDKVLGLETGADDYITKPFSLRELMARVKANIRRRNLDANANSATRTAGGLSLDEAGFVAFKHGKALDLSQKEFDLLRLLMASPGKVFSREALMEKVWSYDYYGDTRTVDVMVRRLREKLEDDPGSPTYILTRRGVGYYFSDEV